MPFRATVAGDVFQRKLEECFGKLKQVINIEDEIMVVWYKPDHSDHDHKFWQAAVQAEWSQFLWWDLHCKWLQAIKWSVSYNSYACTSQ